MNYGEGSTMSPAEVALLDGRNSNRNNDGWGDNGAWWIILFLIFGWGRNGFGNGFGGGSGVGENYVLASDFATLQRQLDSGFDRIGNRIENVNNGLCDGFYAMNTGMLNGFSGVQQTLCQGFSGVNNAITQNGYETRLGVNSLASQLAACCCDIRQQISDCCCGIERGIDGINYNIATNTCAITNALNQGFNGVQQSMCLNTRDIIDNQNANYRAIHEELVANKLEAKNDRIAELTAQVNKLQLAASQEAQNNFLVGKLGPKCPEAAYIVPNPNCCYNYNLTGFGYGNCCGCN